MYSARCGRFSSVAVIRIPPRPDAAVQVRSPLAALSNEPRPFRKTRSLSLTSGGPSKLKMRSKSCSMSHFARSGFSTVPLVVIVWRNEEMEPRATASRSMASPRRSRVHSSIGSPPKYWIVTCPSPWSRNQPICSSKISGVMRGWLSGYRACWKQYVHAMLQRSVRAIRRVENRPRRSWNRRVRAALIRAMAAPGSSGSATRSPASRRSRRVDGAASSGRSIARRSSSSRIQDSRVTLWKATVRPSSSKQWR